MPSSATSSKRDDPRQRRLIDTIRAQSLGEDGAEYWPVVNDWVRDAGRAKSLALRNINATVAAVIRNGYVTLDEDGMCGARGRRAADGRGLRLVSRLEGTDGRGDGEGL